MVEFLYILLIVSWGVFIYLIKYARNRPTCPKCGGLLRSKYANKYPPRVYVCDDCNSKFTEELTVNINKENTDMKIQRVYSSNELDHTNKYGMCTSEYVSSPELIKKIHNHLMNASKFKIYVSDAYIEYSCYTGQHGLVRGGCHKYDYGFFDFSIDKANHRYTIYGADRTNKNIKAFFDWIDEIFTPFKKAYESDRNL